MHIESGLMTQKCAGIDVTEGTFMNRVLISVLLVPLLTFLAVHGLYAAEPCKVIHGRAHFYGGDGQLRIWQIGTHHEYEPDEPSWPRVIKWLEAGVPESERANYASPASSVNLYADFLICPTEPFKQGSVQRATIKSASHRRYVKIEAGSER
jgi:hypothetical protein